MTAPASTRARLLAATEACLRRNGIRRTTMTQIADEAGVSRAGLYKHFPDKPSIIVTALVEADERFWADAAARVSAARGFAIDHQPAALALRLKAEEPEAYAATVGQGLPALVPGMAGFWRPYLQAARDAGDVRTDLDIDAAAEWIMRVVLSLVTIPGPTTPRFIHEYLVASLR
jgi:AcrR family transcriptional regulator